MWNCEETAADPTYDSRHTRQPWNSLIKAAPTNRQVPKTTASTPPPLKCLEFWAEGILLILLWQ